MKASDFKQGDRYEVLMAFSAYVLTTWAAPFTGGDAKMLPVGLQFTISVDPPESASAIAANVEHPDKWQELLVAEEERTAERYTGYYLVIPFNDVSAHCKRAIQI